MSEKRFIVIEEGVEREDTVIEDTITKERYNEYGVVDLLNEQQDQIIYWKHKVNSLLWILGQFDKEKVKKLLKELDDE